MVVVEEMILSENGGKEEALTPLIKEMCAKWCGLQNFNEQNNNLEQIKKIVWIGNLL